MNALLTRKKTKQTRKRKVWSLGCVSYMSRRKDLLNKRTPTPWLVGWVPLRCRECWDGRDEGWTEASIKKPSRQWCNVKSSNKWIAADQQLMCFRECFNISPHHGMGKKKKNYSITAKAENSILWIKLVRYIHWTWGILPGAKISLVACEKGGKKPIGLQMI